jgi:Fic family protein
MEMMILHGEAIDADTLRIRGDFLEMPGLVLTVPQTSRLYGLSTAHATALLDGLVAEGFLVTCGNGTYRRATPPLCD